MDCQNKTNPRINRSQVKHFTDFTLFFKRVFIDPFKVGCVETDFEWLRASACLMRVNTVPHDSIGPESTRAILALPSFIRAVTVSLTAAVKTKRTHREYSCVRTPSGSAYWCSNWTICYQNFIAIFAFAIMANNDNNSLNISV